MYIVFNVYNYMYIVYNVYNVYIFNPYMYFLFL